MTAKETAKETMTCVRCGRRVGVRVVREPRVSHGRAIPPVRVPYPHKRPAAQVEAFGGGEWCEPPRTPANRDSFYGRQP